MPLLNWLSREEDLKTAIKTPYRLLKEVSSLGYGDSSLENMIVQGDNLEALKALLPFYAGQVKCIYIDPPYNTGSAFEHYDDNLEHSTWLSMMYPRLELLREFLREDGSIWISLDDNEQGYAKVICDEVFGRNNFVNNVIWQKKYSPQNDAKYLSDNHDFIMVFAKNKEKWRPKLLPRSEEANARYKNPDNDPKGQWKLITLHAKSGNKTDFEYTFKNGCLWKPIPGTFARFSKETLKQYDNEGKIWFGKDGKSIPSVKKYLSEVKDGVTSLTIWTYDEVGHNHEAKTEVKQFNEKDVFTTPKPERLIERVLTLASNEGDLVLDSFLGSGTTSAVALKMGRRFIGIEMGEHAKTHCVPRLQKVIDGEQGGISKALNWQGGGGFRFFDLGDEVFDSNGQINDRIGFQNLAAHLWFCETKKPLNLQKTASTFLGIHNNTAYALLYNGILKDKRVNGGNVLTSKTYQVILNDIGKTPFEKLIIYGESSRINPSKLKDLNIEFKQTPYDIKAR